jgi:pimeloyl-ACP methyl ester carboxylesterase
MMWKRIHGDCRRATLAISFSCLISFAVSGRAIADLNGHWSGALSRDGSVQVVDFDFAARGEDVAGNYDIPELGHFERPVKTVKVIGDRRFELEFLYGTFACVLHDGIGEIACVQRKQSGVVTHLHLKRSLRPPPCDVREVTIQSQGVALAGSMLLPSNRGPHPAAVILHDAGPRTRETLSYRVYGELCCRNRIAALVYDKRGTGGSEGNFDAASFQDLANDAVAAFRFVQARQGIDASQVGFIGFSQGGYIGPYAASQLDGVAFIVAIGGPAVPVWDQEAHRVEYSMRRNNFSERDIAAASAYTQAMFKATEDRSQWPAFVKMVESARGSTWAEYVSLPDSADELDGWLLERYDPGPILRRTKVPLLALYGGEDTVVPPAENVERMQQALQAAGNRDFEVRVVPTMAHRLYVGEGRYGETSGFPAGFWRWDRLVPGVFEYLIPWTRARVGLQ